MENLKSDDALARDLAELEPGSSLEREENGEKVTYHKPVFYPLCTDHIYQYVGETFDGFKEVQCKCGNGRVLDPKVNILKNGKISRL